jgi:hypothetical protein
MFLYASIDAESFRATVHVLVQLSGADMLWQLVFSGIKVRLCNLIQFLQFRIRRPERVQYRTPIWDSITSLNETQLKKFAQYLINDLPITVRKHLLKIPAGIYNLQFSTFLWLNGTKNCIGF